MLTVSCSADRNALRTDLGETTEPRPTSISRTGIPFLMDLPLIGPLFGSTTRRR